MMTVARKRLLRPLIFCSFVISAGIAFCQTTYVWNQPGTADWNTATNWTPQRNTPAVDDILIFNNGAVTTAINIPTQTVGQLQVSGNTEVNLQAGAAGTVITVSDLPGTDLQVAAGSALNITGTNAATILLAAGADGSLTGTVTFSGAPHRLDAAAAGAIVFNSPAVFTQGTGCTGSVFNTTGTGNIVIFSAGTSMVQYAGGNPFGLAAPNTKVVFQTGSLLKIMQNVLIATQGRTYADVEIDFAAFNQTLTGAASPVTINNLTITQGILNLNFTGASGVNLKGNVFIAAGQALHFNPASPSTVNFNGTITQSITNNGSLTFGANQSVTFNNSAGIVCNSPVTFNATVNFVAGIITAPGPVTITLGAAAIAAGASHSCFVDGRLEKIGNTDFSFPIGKTGFGLVPVTLQNFSAGSATSAFVVTYKRQSANSISTNTAPGIHHVSNLDHWTVENSGTNNPSVDVTLWWNAFTSNNGSVNFITLPGFLDLIAARYDPAVAAWNNYGGQGNTVPGSTAVAGGITWPNVSMLPAGVTACFSLASTTIQNPLPVSITYLTATPQTAFHLLEWKINCGSSAGVSAELQRAGAGNGYTVIETVQCTAADCGQPFSFTDATPLAGINYYRLKITGSNGETCYSNTVTLLNNTGGFSITAVVPTLVKSSAVLRVCSAKRTSLRVFITDISGRIIQRQVYSLAAGSSQLPIPAAGLPAGVYTVTGITAAMQQAVVRFVKE